MRKTLRSILARIPRRRRRFWRYVSPRRRGAGLVLLMLLLGLFYLYWHLTNDRRIRDQAQAYLSQVVGGNVKIHKASFSLFGPIELRGVSVRIPGDDTAEPFFHAQSVVLHHRPWKCLTGGRVQPTRIICVEPVVSVDYYTERSEYNFQTLLKLSGRKRSSALRNLGGLLPPIALRKGRLRFFERRGTNRHLLNEEPLNVSFVPQADGTYYMSFEEPRVGDRPVITGSLHLDPFTGEVNRLVGVFPIEKIRRTLPTEYEQWLRRYKVEGAFGVSRTVSPESPKRELVVDLINVNMEVPATKGSGAAGLRLEQVRGTVRFAEDEKPRIRLENVTGRIRQAGDARFTMNGTYRDIDPESTFHVELVFEGLRVPAPSGEMGDLDDLLRHLHETYRPEGTMDLDVKLDRLTSGGEVAVTGTAKPKDMRLTYKYFDYPLEQVEGEITFSNGRVKVDRLHGTHNRTSVTLTGWVEYGEGPDTYDIVATAERLGFDEDLRKALPKRFLSFWNETSPAGQADARIHFWRGREDTHDRFEATMTAAGRASMAYKHLPYRLENLAGELDIQETGFRIDSMVSRKGEKLVKVRGGASWADPEKPEVDITVEGKRVPLDEALMEALGGKGAEIVRQLAPSGLADTVSARVTQSAGGEIEYTVDAELKDVSFTFSLFPYEVNAAEGRLTICPDRVVIDRLRGKHGETPINITGQVFTASEGIGLDLNVRGEGIAFDEELHAALPSHVKKVWKRLRPGGKGDMNLDIRYNTPTLPEKVDYRLTLEVRGMSARYSAFPYPFRGITGTIVAVPGKVTLGTTDERTGKLVPLTAAHGEMKASISGVFLTDELRDTAELRITATAIPIDATLINAMPPELAPIMSRFKPGGTCDVDLPSLKVTVAGSPTSGPATTKPASTRPAGGESEVSYDARGSISFRNAAIDIGFGVKVLTGTIKGEGGRTPKGMSLEADVICERIMVGQRKVTDVRGRLLKDPAGAIVHLKDIQGKAHGGRLAGLAEIRLADPVEFAVALEIEDIDLHDMLNAGIKDPKKKTRIAGKVKGNLHLSTTAGKPDSTQAAGELVVTEAKLIEMPVMLGLLHVFTLALPTDSPFNDGFMTYHLRGRKLTFQEVYFMGPRLTMIGSGTVDLKTEKLNLNFLTAPKLPRMSELAEEIVRGIGSELAEVQVRGTVSKPRTRTVALRSLNAAIRKLLTPGTEDE